MKSYLVTVITLVLFTSCATYKPPAYYKVEKKRIIYSDFDNVWNRTIEWFALQGTPIKQLAKESGFISTDMVLSRDNNYMDCGSGGAGLFYSVDVQDPTGTFNIYVKKLEEEKVEININCFFNTVASVRDNRSGYTTASANKECNSTGRLEKDFLDSICSGLQYDNTDVGVQPAKNKK